MTDNYIAKEQWTADSYLCHHGIKGMKWGIRRFQNPDGTLTEAGKKRYYQTGKYPWSGFQLSDKKVKKGKEKRFVNKDGTLTDLAKAETRDMKGFSDEDKRLYLVDRDAFYNKMERDTDTRGIKDKTQKAKMEKDILEAYQNPKGLSVNSKTDQLATALTGRITRESGDFYEGIGKSKGFIKAIKDYENASSSKEKERIKDDLAETVLKDIGYEVNKNNKKLIRSFIYVD